MYNSLLRDLCDNSVYKLCTGCVITARYFKTVDNLRAVIHQAVHGLCMELSIRYLGSYAQIHHLLSDLMTSVGMVEAESPTIRQSALKAWTAPGRQTDAV